MPTGKLDPRLRYLQDQLKPERTEFMESVRMACAAPAPGLETVEVLLRCRQ